MEMPVFIIDTEGNLHAYPSGVPIPRKGDTLRIHISNDQDSLILMVKSVQFELKPGSEAIFITCFSDKEREVISRSEAYLLKVALVTDELDGDWDSEELLRERLTDLLQSP